MVKKDSAFFALSFTLASNYVFLLARLDVTYHTLIYTFTFNTKLQYIGLIQENAESLAPLFYSRHLVPERILGKCELRDAIFRSCLVEFNNSSFHHYLRFPLVLRSV
jgi:hypothetical protein